MPKPKDRPYGSEVYSNLKMETKLFFQKAGGAEFLEEHTRVGSTWLYAYGSDESEAFAAIDVIADVEKLYGKPVITRVLAKLTGHKLVPVTPIKSSDLDITDADMALVVEIGSVAQSRIEMDRDGVRKLHELQAHLKKQKSAEDTAAIAVRVTETEIAELIHSYEDGTHLREVNT